MATNISPPTVVTKVTLPVVSCRAVVVSLTTLTFLHLFPNYFHSFYWITVKVLQLSSNELVTSAGIFW